MLRYSSTHPHFPMSASARCSVKMISNGLLSARWITEFGIWEEMSAQLRRRTQTFTVHIARSRACVRNVEPAAQLPRHAPACERTVLRSLVAFACAHNHIADFLPFQNSVSASWFMFLSGKRLFARGQEGISNMGLPL